MYRIRTIYQYSQLDQSLKTFLQKYKTTPKSKDEQTPNIISKTRQSIAKQMYPSHQQDNLKEKYLLSKVKEIPLQDRSIFSHFNRPQQLSLNREKEQLMKKLNQSAKAMEEQLVGEEFIDQYEYPADFVYRIERSRMEGMAKVEKAMETHDPESSDLELYESIAEWKEINKFEKPIYNRMKNEQIKPYPGTEKGPLPIQDPEGFTDWFINNHSPQLVEEVDNYVQQVVPDIADTNDLSDDDAANEENQEEDENNIGDEQPDHEVEALVAEGPLAFMKESLVSCLINGEPFDDMEEFSNVQIRSPLEDGELEPAPKNLPYDYVESLYYMERWTLFRMLPSLEKIKDNLFDGESKQFETQSHGSLNTYYQLLPKAMREHPNVKNVYRGLEWHNPGMTMQQKEQGLNYAARLSQPLSLLTQDIMDEIGKTRKQHPTRFDEESFITDQEQECIDPAVNPEVTEAYLDKRATIKEGTEGDWPQPDWVKDKKERIDDLPVDFYINDDGFWDEYIQIKEQRHLDGSKLGGKKMYLKH